MTKKDWRNPHSIRFTRQEIKWLIPILPMLRDGEYPPNPRDADSGYIKGGGRPLFRSDAKFETPAGLAAELDFRIQRAGLNGLLVELLYSSEPDDEVFVIQHIAEALGEDTWAVDKRIDKALSYIAGDNRKKLSYKEWLGHRKPGGE